MRQWTAFSAGCSGWELSQGVVGDGQLVLGLEVVGGQLLQLYTVYCVDVELLQLDVGVVARV